MTAGKARLLTLLKPSQGGLLWRTAKADVAHELGLPPQHQHTSSLQFSAIERHFYSRQHAECSLRASSTISSQLLSQAAQGLAGQRRLTAAEEKKLLFPLLRLRQACCHPQVGCSLFTLAPHLLSQHPYCQIDSLRISCSDLTLSWYHGRHGSVRYKAIVSSKLLMRWLRHVHCNPSFLAAAALWQLP